RDRNVTGVQTCALPIYILFAVGAWKPGRLDIPGNVKPVIAWMRAVKAGQRETLGHVAVVGGGNTAMDAARLALRAGAASSTLVRSEERRVGDEGRAGGP